MRNTHFRTWLLVLVSVVWLVACISPGPARVPEERGDGWQTASLREVGLSESRIEKAVSRIRDGTYENVHSMLIVKDGKLVFEAYFPGYAWRYDDPQHQGDWVEFDADTNHNLASVTKSVTSVLVGIALDRGLIESVDDRVFSYFPEYAHLSDPAKDRMTLAHLLTMSSGLAWNEMELPYSDQRNDLVQLFWVSDPIAYILAKPAIHEPGSHWYYNGGCTNLLGEVIRAVTGQRMDAFAAEVLFGPLGISDYEWDFINPDMIHASGNLRLRPRDMAKLGLLYVDGGVWQGERLVSEAWVEASTRKHASPYEGAGYGYQWWLRTYHDGSEVYDAFYAAGWGGQFIIVFPGLDMVLVFTGGNYVDEPPVDDIITQCVLPALR
jgi:CubicO group peptidase (beta-lactamase class C family)